MSEWKGFKLLSYQPRAVINHPNNYQWAELLDHKDPNMYHAWLLVLEKWEVANDNRRSFLYLDDVGGKYKCAFCYLFNPWPILTHFGYQPMCENCPIFQDTGRTECSGTPYGDIGLVDIPMHESITNEWEYLNTLFIEWLNSEKAEEYYYDMNDEHLALVYGEFDITPYLGGTTIESFNNLLEAINRAEKLAKYGSGVRKVWRRGGNLVWEVDERVVHNAS